MLVHTAPVQVTVAVEEMPTKTSEVTASVPADGGPATVTEVTEVVTTEEPAPADVPEAAVETQPAAAAEAVQEAAEAVVAAAPDLIVTEVSEPVVTEANAPADADMAEEAAVVTQLTETVVVDDGPAVTKTTTATTDADGDTVVVRLSPCPSQPEQALDRRQPAQAAARPSAELHCCTCRPRALRQKLVPSLRLSRSQTVQQQLMQHHHQQQQLCNQGASAQLLLGG